MARKSRRKDPALTPPPLETLPPAAATPWARLPARLREAPCDYRFFQAVRLIQQLLPDRGTVGQFTEPGHEAVRFRSHQTLGYPASEIQSFEEAGGDAPASMAVNFMGLTGPVGELPVFYTAHVLERLRAGDATLAGFLDIFNHRFVSLFYRAWEKYRFTVPYERGEAGGLRQYLSDLLGIGTRGLQNRQAVNDESLIFYSGLLTQQPRSAEALKQILMDYFEVPVEIVQFVGAWRELAEHDLCRLEDDPDEAPWVRLGEGTVAGDEVWDPQSAVRIRIGPLPLARYLQFLPNGDAHRPLQAMLRFFSGDSLDFEVQLVLNRADAPSLELGAEGDGAAQLGWLSWVKSRPLDRDPDDTILRLWEES